MSKFTNISAIIAIWLVTAIAVVSICKIVGIQLPIVAKIPNSEWLELVIKFLGLLLT